MKRRRFLTPQLNNRWNNLPAYLVAMALHGFLLLYAGLLIFSNENVLAQTSTDYRFYDTFALTLNKYEALNSLYRDDRSFAIPGLTNTNILGNGSSQMVPQGICKAGDYILISAYNASSNKWVKKKGKSIQNSVIYILSESGEYLNTLVLPDINHVGGLTFDGLNVWVAKGKNKSCSIIPYETIQLFAESGETSMLEEYFADLFCNRSASFVEYHDGKLWIGTFAKNGSGYSEVGIYEMGNSSNNYELTQISTLRLPEQAQGISFLKQGGEDYMIVSTSYGRIYNSIYYLYKLNLERNEYYVDYRGKCEMPPMSEEMYSDGEYCYLMFESGATEYCTTPVFRCKNPIDRVCAVENSSLIAMMK